MKLAEWLDRNATKARLTAQGMSDDCASGATTCFSQAAASLQQTGLDPSAEVVACWAPGRIEVLGKHTDYCGGSSILAAVERGFCMLAVPRDDGVVAVLDLGSTIREVVLDPNTEPKVGHWTNYPHTVVRRFARNFPESRRGATFAFVSNLPPSSGMSSSSAFVVGVFLLLASINDLARDPAYRDTIRSREDLAGYLGSVENGTSFGPLAGDRGVGTFGGSEDHTAILCSQPNRLVQYAYCPVRFQRTIELADDYVFVIANSGVIAEKTGDALAKYNRVSAMVRTIVSTWRTATGGDEQSLAAILAALNGDSAQLRAQLVAHTDVATAADLVERLFHFTTESRLIETTPGSINASTKAAFGNVAYESHSLADQHLKNQTSETNGLVQIAKELDAPAASAFGAGFGGSVWALVNRSFAPEFVAKWKAEYQRTFADSAPRSAFFVTNSGIAAIAVS